LRLAAGVLFLAALAMGCGATRAVGQDNPPASPWTMTGAIANAKAAEASGLAASIVNPGLLWTINDSENEPVVFALGPQGQNLGAIYVVGAANRDWEDLAVFEMDGQPLLLIADVGDNKSRRPEVTLYVMAEPRIEAPGQPASAAVAWQMRLRYPDGPRDCEAVAVDPQAKMVYLLSKRTRPPVLYAADLRPTAADAVVTVRRLVELPLIEKAHEDLPPAGPVNALFGSQPTAMDLSPDNRQALVLTYQGLCLFRRGPGQTWTEALAAKPLFTALPPLKQAEGACFGRSADAVWVTSEGRGAPLYRLDPTGAFAPAP